MLLRRLIFKNKRSDVFARMRWYRFARHC